MKPVKTYSPVVFGGAVGLGLLAFVGLLLVAWTSDTAEVGLSVMSKLTLSLSAIVLGGGLVGWGVHYRARATEEAELRAMVQRNLRP